MSPAEALPHPTPTRMPPPPHTRAHTHALPRVSAHACAHTHPRTARVSAHAHTHAHCPCVCLQEDGLPSAEAALLLHRKGFDCGLEAKNLGFNCTTSQGKVSRALVWEGSRGAGKQSTRNSGQRAR